MEKTTIIFIVEHGVAVRGKLGVYENYESVEHGRSLWEVPVDPYPLAYWTLCETYKIWAVDLTSNC